ncbi:MAG TPA: futalosine hydrolase [Candidatus Tumulicola sp.]
MRRVLLTCAVERELSWWIDRPNVAVLVSGVGPVEAALAVANALHAGAFDLVVDAGIAGGLAESASIGEGVVVSRDAFELALEDGRPLALPPGSSVVDRVESDPVLVAALQANGFAAVRGVTVSHVTSTEATARRLAGSGAQVESMEGFAVLRACALAGVPAVQIRGISNRVGDRERAGWNFQAGLDGLARIATVLFDYIATEDTV